MLIWDAVLMQPAAAIAGFPVSRSHFAGPPVPPDDLRLEISQARLVLAGLGPMVDVPDLSPWDDGPCRTRLVIGLPQPGERVWDCILAGRRRCSCRMWNAAVIVQAIIGRHGKVLSTITRPQASSEGASGSQESRVRIPDLGSGFLRC